MNKIGYIDETWNPVTGCSPDPCLRISPGCDHCWAERMAKRQAGRNGYDANHPFRPTLHADKLDLPLRWKKPRRIATCFMGDLFHEDVPDAWRRSVHRVMWRAEHHTFLLLTKRPESALQFYTEFRCWLLPNVWLGVSVELWEHLDRVETLLQIPGRRWVSFEPLLGAIDAKPSVRDVDWVVAGAETGPGARPADVDWFRWIRDPCALFGVPFWLKSLGPGKGDVLDGRRHKELPT